ncbi:MAG: putative terminase large subunit [Prokaryotic dsDNA virus sp.]|nr:MAG: putative terminase large subunit [Prokaryotic dsDNA virus sp.]|tara:strand:+ start:6765 stop:8171 length:1407 start_codon:yes stop_codon:yes gene_type:complete
MTKQLDENDVLALCRASPIWFCTYVIGFSQAKLHKRLNGHLSEFDNCYIELPRGHGKTSQMAARCAWEIGRNPNVRIKYIQQSDRDASKTTALVKNIIESPKFQAVFPNITPVKDFWGNTDFKVHCDSWQRDSTMEAKGIFGRAGGRADILIADDICDLRNSVQQPSLREQVKDFWNNNWLPMRDFTAGKEPKTWKIGTCYHVDDITADWRKQHQDDGGLLRIPVDGFDSPWPEEITPELLQEIRDEIGPVAYGRAYELLPISAETMIFSGDWLNSSSYDPSTRPENGEMVAAFDFAFSESRSGGDPDYSVCLIAWLGFDNHLYLVDMLRVRATFPDFSRRALGLCHHHGVVRAIGEANGPQKGLVQQMNEASRFPIMPAKRTTDKVTRAAARQAFVEGGRLHFPSNKSIILPAFEPLFDEMTTFPIAAHDDTVDACIDLMDLASKSKPPPKPNRIERATGLSRVYGA